MFFAAKLSSPEYRDDRLNVCRGRAFFVTLTMFCGACFLIFVCRTGRPGGVLANVRSQDLHDRPVVVGGAFGDPLEGVDATQADIQLLVAELVDRSGESLGDLPLAFELIRSGRRFGRSLRRLTIEPKRLSREVKTGGQNEARKTLEQGASHVVFCLAFAGQ